MQCGSEKAAWRIAADTGGTFTDAIGISPAGERVRVKVLSSGALRVRLAACDGRRWQVEAGWQAPADFLRGATVSGERTVLGRISADAVNEGWIEVEPAPGAPAPEVGERLTLRTGEEAPVLATRLLTGTPAGERPPPVELRLGTTRGTNALLEGKGARVALFVTRGFRDLTTIRDQKRPELFARLVRRPAGLNVRVWEVDGRLDAEGRELLPLDPGALDQAIAEARAAGCEAAAVSLLHAYQNSEHEERVLEKLQQAGFRYAVRSTELRNFIHYLNRTETAVVDATLGPILEDYLNGIEAGAGEAALLIMTSGGGLAPRSRFRAKDSLLSGPAGGVGGAGAEARRQGLKRVVTFDMGGTSTDVARWDGDFSFRELQTVGPARVLARAVRIETVAAGGGSICRVHDGRPLVGPESAGAEPGPACYGAGGPLTLSDVNLLLGRLDPAAFSIPMDRAAAEAAFEAEFTAAGGTLERRELLEGWLHLADLRMAQAIREISVRDGYDPKGYAVVAFGGAGGLHACAVAQMLGLREIVFPDSAGLLSAEGIAEAALETTAERQLLVALDARAPLAVWRRELEQEASSALQREGVAGAKQEIVEASLDVRLRGQDASLTLPWDAAPEAAFRRRFEEIFGYAVGDRPLELVAARVRVRAVTGALELEHYPAGRVVKSSRHQPACFGGEWREMAVLRREELPVGGVIEGPALVVDPFSTLVVAPGWEGRVGDRRTVRLGRVETEAPERASAGGSSVVERELLLHRCYGLVGEMGEQLRRTALSPNIRERLDFSCALLDRQGRLLVNAPHIPVHLGALGECVRAVLAERSLRPGDVVVTNHPRFGGSHLPDVTVLSGVFSGDTLIAVLANRAHHAEWGGRRPGSMPAEARCLEEEGVVLRPRLLFDRGEPRFEALERCLREAPFPSRAVAENLADLHAQVAALRMGAKGLRGLLEEVGRAAVERFLEEASGLAARVAERVLAGWPEGVSTVRDTLDDGTPLQVAVTVADGRMTVDFTGTGPTHPGNLNATPAIVRSALLYIVRLMVDEAVPLNEGLLDPVHLILPEGLLNPPFVDDPAACPAVVGGNVETSQRLVDLLGEALGLFAPGPGTMNNVLFGAEDFGFYETIGGGVGASPGAAGESGVHVHMTNTAITDPEILEQRYPVRLWQFALRVGSGGVGRWNGGDGLVREYEWRRAVTVSLLTQRRAAGPRGVAGGGAGAPGAQARLAPGTRAWEPLPGIVSWEAVAGERLRLETPGGGGWGVAGEGDPACSAGGSTQVSGDGCSPP